MTPSKKHHASISKIHRIYSLGEMAELVRNFDWANTSVGAIEDWPGLLLNTVSTLLSSRQPMLRWWGQDLLQFYNDAYRTSLGTDKHPSALGQCGAECWPETWNLIALLIENVMTNGEAHWCEDQLIPIFRDGKLVDVYWTFSYSRPGTQRGVSAAPASSVRTRVRTAEDEGCDYRLAGVGGRVA